MRGAIDDPVVRPFGPASLSMLPLWLSSSARGDPRCVTQLTTTSDRGSGTGSGFKSAASTSPKIAVFAPMPMMSDITTAIAMTGVFRNCRRP
jgi:hypothetical protein